MYCTEWSNSNILEYVQRYPIQISTGLPTILTKIICTCTLRIQFYTPVSTRL